MHRSVRSVRTLLSLSALLVLAAAPLRAQGPSASTEAVEISAPDSVVAAGPTLGNATVGVRHVDPAAAAKAAPAAPRGGGRGHGEVLMIVGGAAILTGIVVGNSAGYAISIAGAVIGLYGLYEYLQ